MAVKRAEKTLTYGEEVESVALVPDGWVRIVTDALSAHGLAVGHFVEVVLTPATAIRLATFKVDVDEARPEMSVITGPLVMED